MPKIPLMGARIPTMDTRRARIEYAPVKPKVSEPFYSSAAWIELRDRVRREAQGKCQWPGCRARGRWVDHKIERKDGGADLDRANVWYLCASHHTTKTAIERAKRGHKGYN